MTACCPLQAEWEAHWDLPSVGVMTPSNGLVTILEAIALGIPGVNRIIRHDCEAKHDKH